MEQQGPENQNLIEAIGMEPERFDAISEDVKSQVFTSPGYLQNVHNLSDEESEIVLTELQNRGLVGKESVSGSYGVFPEGVTSRELTKKQKIQTSKLGRAVLMPITQSTQEYGDVTVKRAKFVAHVTTAGSLRAKRKQDKAAQQSRKKADQAWKESYEERVKKIAEEGGLPASTTPTEKGRPTQPEQLNFLQIEDMWHHIEGTVANMHGASEQKKDAMRRYMRQELLETLSPQHKLEALSAFESLDAVALSQESTPVEPQEAKPAPSGNSLAARLERARKEAQEKQRTQELEIEPGFVIPTIDQIREEINHRVAVAKRADSSEDFTRLDRRTAISLLNEYLDQMNDHNVDQGIKDAFFERFTSEFIDK